MLSRRAGGALCHDFIPPLLNENHVLQLDNPNGLIHHVHIQRHNIIIAHLGMVIL